MKVEHHITNILDIWHIDTKSNYLTIMYNRENFFLRYYSNRVAISGNEKNISLLIKQIFSAKTIKRTR
jgi:hypothetical protein